MNEKVEQVAAALADAEFGAGMWAIREHSEAFRDRYRSRARSAILAMREPTDEMIAAGEGCDEPSELGACADALTHWAAMIEAALKE